MSALGTIGIIITTLFGILVSEPLIGIVVVAIVIMICFFIITLVTDMFHRGGTVMVIILLILFLLLAMYTLNSKVNFIETFKKILGNVTIASQGNKTNLFE